MIASRLGIAKQSVAQETVPALRRVPSILSHRFHRRSAWLAKFFAISPAEGAQTIIYLASSPEVANVTGLYFYKCRPTTPSAPALDDRAALALWERSAALTDMNESDRRRL